MRRRIDPAAAFRPARRWLATALSAVSMAALAQVTPAPTVADAPRVLTLPQAYEAALNFDARYLAATKELDAARLGVPLARAGLRPQVSLNAGYSRVGGEREFGNALNQSVRVPLDYESPQLSLNLRSPVFNYEALSRLRQATSQAESAEALLAARHMDMVVRLATAYLEVLVQQEVVQVVAQELHSLQAQSERAAQRFARGEGTRQETATTAAEYELALTRLTQARDALDMGLHELRSITGLQAVALRAVPPGFGALGLPLPDLEAWRTHALQHNPLLRFRTLNIESARHALERQRAGHLPRLDLVASLSRGTNDSVSTLNQTTQQRSIGLQLAVPLYSGGAVQAGMAQARAERERSEQELRAERESVLMEVERLYRLVLLGSERLVAHRRALDAAGVAVQAATRALETGLGTTAELREAIARQAAARRHLVEARYGYLNQRAQLLIVAGWPLASVLEDLDRALSSDAVMQEKPL